MTKKKNDNEYKLVNQNQFHIVEAYKSLRTNLEYSIIEDKNKVILVTSSVPREGKSSITANLGIYLTYIGYKVLIVDCDFRKPKQNRFFNLSNQIGIVNVIMKKAELKNVLHHVNSKLDIITTGPIPPNPIELLSSKEMEELIQEVSAKYNYVLIDSPPAATLSDAVVLAPHTDGVLLVIKHSSTKIEVIKQAIENLNNAKANILGTVISQINTKIDSYYRYRYNDSYYEENKAKKQKRKHFRTICKYLSILVRYVKDHLKILVQYVKKRFKIVRKYDVFERVSHHMQKKFKKEKSYMSKKKKTNTGKKHPND